MLADLEYVIFGGWLGLLHYKEFVVWIRGIVHTRKIEVSHGCQWNNDTAKKESAERCLGSRLWQTVLQPTLLSSYRFSHQRDLASKAGLINPKQVDVR